MVLSKVFLPALYSIALIIVPIFTTIESAKIIVHTVLLAGKDFVEQN
jgi:hypothetical protein